MVLFLLLITLITNGIAKDLTPVVQTRLGPVQGIRESGENGVIDKYLGIPYASVDPLNSFGDPISVTPWDEVFQAESDSKICPQIGAAVYQFADSADCLILNVFVPYNASNNTKLPVMVRTHGGGYQSGSLDQNILGPDEIVRYDVILVTHNYRLGPFGFMCLGNNDVPGNAGLKDTLLAYRWVQENIAAFGGDPDNVTAFGQSVGSFIVDFMILYPLGKGLFHKAILQSGTVLNRYLKNDYELNKRNAFQLAHSLGYEGETIEGVLPFLSLIDPSHVIEAAVSLDFYYAPCLENEMTGNMSYLTHKPYEIYKTGNYSKIPMVIGVNSNEGLRFTEPLRKQGNLDNFFNAFIDSYIYSLAGDYTFYFENTEEQAKVAQLIRKFYFSDGNMTSDEIDDFVSDIMFVISSDRALEMYLEQDHEPVYYYLFAYDGDRNYYKRQNNVTCEGAAHGDELSYLFSQTIWDGITDRDRIVTDRMTTMWTNFAKYANPTPVITDLLSIEWKQAQLNERNYLRIDEELSTGLRAFNERMVFWELLRQAYGEPLRRGMIDFSSELEVKFKEYMINYEG